MEGSVAGASIVQSRWLPFLIDAKAPKKNEESMASPQEAPRTQVKGIFPTPSVGALVYTEQVPSSAAKPAKQINIPIAYIKIEGGVRVETADSYFFGVTGVKVGYPLMSKYNPNGDTTAGYSETQIGYGWKHKGFEIGVEMEMRLKFVKDLWVRPMASIKTPVTNTTIKAGSMHHTWNGNGVAAKPGARFTYQVVQPLISVQTDKGALGAVYIFEGEVLNPQSWWMNNILAFKWAY
jgi:hypothetical protein